MLMLRRFFCYASLVAALAVVASARQPEVAIDALGPQVGAVVPALAGVDQFNRPQTLESVSGPEGAMVVFFRSADW